MTRPPKTKPVLGADGALADLTGLWEAGTERAKSQMCIIEDAKVGASFAVVLRGQGERSCSGGGTLRRDGATVHIVMAGESDCAFDAAVAGMDIVFPRSVPAGCAYYCTAGTSFSGARLSLVAPSIEDARRARDLVGEPLCGTR
ncbi:hypothetical protein IC614_01920 [Allosphingosinicella flava]|uniref:Uncharacterized protein n=1 Tax=Allosphingosinicella flava TaxID=2771430 RepID=A0A7T2GK98_9SPHN|nr:hypothetical protein [Sphingosinicella flava]QPQ55392.1 hypothetical protein IC614_01920 [Sphingosinicella flava]